MPNTILPTVRKQIDQRRVYYLLLTSVASVMTYTCVCIRRVVRCQAVLSCLLLDLRGVVIFHVCPYSFQSNRDWDATTSLVSTHIDRWRIFRTTLYFEKRKRDKETITEIIRNCN